MIDYDSFSRCHLRDIFFAFHEGAKELETTKSDISCTNGVDNGQVF